MADRKPLPRQTLANLLPPLVDYVYFEQPGEFPFRPRAVGYDLVNAGWLMDAALLVYGRDDFIRERVARLAAELPGVKLRILQGISTQALVLHTPEFAIVAFRGTRVEVLPDVIDWLQRRQTGAGPEVPLGGKLPVVHWRDVVSDAKFALGKDGIHTGFRQALDQPGVWDEIVAHLETLGERPVWLTGHSLGAALATIAASRLAAQRPVQGLYTFGSPRVGNRAFRATVPAHAVRFVNNADVVTRLPPHIVGYTHVGELRFIGADGTIAATNAGREGLQQRLQRAFQEWRLLLPRGVQKSLVRPAEFIRDVRNLDIELPSSSWSDHAPVNYACRIWNAVGNAEN